MDRRDLQCGLQLPAIKRRTRFDLSRISLVDIERLLSDIWDHDFAQSDLIGRLRKNQIILISGDSRLIARLTEEKKRNKTLRNLVTALRKKVKA